MHEIENPAWAFSPRRELNHRWSWLKRKTTFDTVASTEEYVLDRDVSHIAIVTQRTSPSRLTRITDEDLYFHDPDPSDSSGNPEFYRVWELSGVATKLAVADTIDVVSSSASDASDPDLTVTVWGFVGGILQSETYTLNGTTTVAGSSTFQARDVFVSKSKDTAGTITVKENSGGTTLVTLGKEERAPLFKVLSLYPIPSSAMTVYVQYYSHLKELVNPGDVPQFSQNWHYVVRLGTLAKTYQHLGKDTDFAVTQGLYSSAVRAMVESDRGVSDLKDHLRRHKVDMHSSLIRRSTSDVA